MFLVVHVWVSTRQEYFKANSDSSEADRQYLLSRHEILQKECGNVGGQRKLEILEKYIDIIPKYFNVIFNDAVN